MLHPQWGKVGGVFTKHQRVLIFHLTALGGFGELHPNYSFVHRLLGLATRNGKAVSCRGVFALKPISEGDFFPESLGPHRRGLLGVRGHASFFLLELSPLLDVQIERGYVHCDGVVSKRRLLSDRLCSGALLV